MVYSFLHYDSTNVKHCLMRTFDKVSSKFQIACCSGNSKDENGGGVSAEESDNNTALVNEFRVSRIYQGKIQKCCFPLISSVLTSYLMLWTTATSVKFTAHVRRGIRAHHGNKVFRKLSTNFSPISTLDQCIKEIKLADTNHDGVLTSDEFVYFIDLQPNNSFGNVTKFTDLPLNIISLFNDSACDCKKNIACCSGVNSSATPFINITASDNTARFCFDLFQAKSITRVVPPKEEFDTTVTLGVAFIAFVAGILTVGCLYKSLRPTEGHVNYRVKIRRVSPIDSPNLCKECLEERSLEGPAKSNISSNEASSSGWSSSSSVPSSKSDSLDSIVFENGVLLIGTPTDFDDTVTSAADKKQTIGEFQISNIEDIADLKNGKQANASLLNQKDNSRGDSPFKSRICIDMSQIASGISGKSYAKKRHTGNSISANESSKELNATSGVSKIPHTIIVVIASVGENLVRNNGADTEDVSSVSLQSESNETIESSYAELENKSSSTGNGSACHDGTLIHNIVEDIIA